MNSCDPVEVDFLVIGSGPTGLGAARQLQQNGISNWALLDASTSAGGLASSFIDDMGFTWDIGGHVQFSHYEYFDQAMREFLGADGWGHHERQAWVWLRERFIPYPFQNNIHRLPIDELEACLLGLVDSVSKPTAAPTNFQEWILASFGEGIADVFMGPYNEKVWAHPLDSLNTAWIGERVATVDLSRILRNLLRNVDDRAWGPNNTFAFPRRGGTGAIWSACASTLPPERLLYGEEVVQIDLGQHLCRTASGREFKYESLVSTMPLRELVRVSNQVQLNELVARGLLSSSSNIVGVGLCGKTPASLVDKCWMYFPEANCPFYRATVFSNYSPFNVPDHTKHWSLMFEVSESIYRPVDQSQLVSSVVEAARSVGLIDDCSEVVSTWRYQAQYGYPTPGRYRDETLSELIPFFDLHNVFSRGRFGMWKYEVSNQDHSFMQGVEVVESLLNGHQEITAFDANYANSKRHPWPFDRWSG